MPKVTIQRRIDLIDPELAKAYFAANKLRNDLQAKLVSAYFASPEGESVRAIQQVGFPKARVDQYDNLTCEFEPYFVQNVEAKPTRPAVYMEPTVVNNLLNSKLLTDDQKRRLIAAQFPHLNLEEKEPADEA